MLYIPVCPTTEASARYVARQRDAFLHGTPAPDFPGGQGESEHVGRPTAEHVRKHGDPIGVQSMGLDTLTVVNGETPGGEDAVKHANAVLGL